MYFGLGIQIKLSKETLTNEAKRTGFMSERNLDVQLRINDRFIIYISRLNKRIR